MTWVPPQRPLPAKRYGWWRAYRGLTRHSKWRLVAAKTKLPLERVTLIAIDLMDQANASEPRGSIGEFCLEEYAAHFAIDPEEVARVRACLEEVGWIDQDFLVTWAERQYESDNDPGATARQRRRRDRLKAKREGAYPQAAGVTRESRVTNRDSRDVTIEQSRPIKKEGLAEQAAGGAETSIHRNIGESGDETELWLALEGRRIVAECLEVTATGAQVRISRWKKTLGDDAAAGLALTRIIQAAEATDLRGARFHNLISDQVARHYRQIGGQGTLPLMPPRPKRRDYG